MQRENAVLNERVSDLSTQVQSLSEQLRRVRELNAIEQKAAGRMSIRKAGAGRSAEAEGVWWSKMR
jgi:hypothetical protein